MCYYKVLCFCKLSMSALYIYIEHLYRAAVCYAVLIQYPQMGKPLKRIFHILQVVA